MVCRGLGSELGLRGICVEACRGSGETRTRDVRSQLAGSKSVLPLINADFISLSAIRGASLLAQPAERPGRHPGMALGCFSQGRQRCKQMPYTHTHTHTHTQTHTQTHVRRASCVHAPATCAKTFGYRETQFRAPHWCALHPHANVCACAHTRTHTQICVQITNPIASS